MTASTPSVVVAGHICLDVIPAIPQRDGGFDALFVPGSLVEIGSAVVATGGAVSNTGLALHRLGAATRLMGKIGDDLFGGAIREVLRGYDPALAEGMIVSPGAASSYTVVVSPPGVDRVFLHCPGANDTFAAEDVPYAQLRGVRLFHFGYPPLMRRFYEDGGEQLETLFQTVAAQGPATSLDMAYPDAASAAGRADWPQILRRALPHVDIFLPSVEELLFMLDRPRWEALAGRGDVLAQVDGALLSELAQRVLDLGVAVAGLKLGDLGFYVRTTDDVDRLARVAAAAGGRLEGWAGRELISPCFKVDVVTAAGAGDCTIAGLLASVLHGLPLEDALTSAVGVGACNCEQPDAFSGVPAWETVQQRIAASWPRQTLPDWPGWTPAGALLRGPHDG